MAKSLICNVKECFLCKTTTGIHKHHIFGAYNRNNSEKYGCWVYLCGKHHNLSDEGIHFNKKLNISMKKYCQRQFELKHSHKEFIEIFGKNYL